IRCAAICACILVVAGCQSGKWGPYSSPRVTGQVLAADTRQPLAGVSVLRGGLEPRSQSGSPPKGGGLMMRKAPVHTNQDGEFALESERVLSLYRGTGWNQVRLRFAKPGYLTLQTNYSLSLGTNAAGEPSLAVGQVFLQPAAR